MKTEYQIIDGKPHFGIFFGISIIADADAFVSPLEENPILNLYRKRLQKQANLILQIDPTLLMRDYTEILRSPYDTTDCLCLNGSVSGKFMIWGRAYKVMRLLILGVNRYKKRRRNGKWKRVRIDKRRRITNGTRS